MQAKSSPEQKVELCSVILIEALFNIAFLHSFPPSLLLLSLSLSIHTHTHRDTYTDTDTHTHTGACDEIDSMKMQGSAGWDVGEGSDEQTQEMPMDWDR